mgnify:CR=1 FL=1
MAQQTLNVGSNANDGTGDTLRAAMIKVNEMFTEVYNSPGIAADTISISGNDISAVRSNDDLILSAAGTGNIILGALTINGTTLSSTDSSSININEGLIVDGTASVLSTLTTPTIATNNIGASDSSSVAFTSPVEFQGAVQGITSLKAAGLTYPTSDGSPGQFLKTDGSGTLSVSYTHLTLPTSDLV